MLDKIVAALAILTLIASVGVVIWFVPAPDLTIISILVVSMAVFDFYHLVFDRKNSKD